MENVEYVGNKIQLYPNEEQKKILNRYFGIMRYVYNYAVEVQCDSLEKKNKILSQFELNNLFTEFKNKPENSWLLEFDSTTMKIALFDATTAFKRYLSKISCHPTFKSKKKIDKRSFAVRADRIIINEKYIRISSKIAGTIKCCKVPNEYCIGSSYVYRENLRHTERKYYNTRITFDEEKYYLSFTMKRSDDMDFASCKKFQDKIQNTDSSDIIGIDLGCSKNNWIVDSNGTRISLPNSNKEKKKIKRLQTKLNRQYKINASRLKEQDIMRTKNMEKIIVKINKYYHKIVNRKINTIHNYVSHDILEKNPKAVVIEDLRVSNMLIKDTKKMPTKSKNAYNINILEHCLNKVQNIIKYKCNVNGIKVITADMTYPSTNRCSNCGNIHNIGSRKIYRCPVCGLVMNRDDNASKNLAIYPTLNLS